MFAASVIAGAVQFAVAIYLFGGWNAFVSHRSLIVLIVVTFAMLCIAPFSNVNLNSGEKEDRANRWVFLAFGVIALASAIVPPYTDRLGFSTIDGDTTRWVGVVVYSFGGALRLYPVFMLGRRFSGLVAIQTDHKLETRGIYSIDSQSQLSRHDRQYDRLGTCLSRLVRRRDRISSAISARRPHPLRRAAAPRNISALNTTPISRAPGAFCPVSTSSIPLSGYPSESFLPYVLALDVTSRSPFPKRTLDNHNQRKVNETNRKCA